MTPPETAQTLPLPSTICAAAGMVVPLTDAVSVPAAPGTDAAATLLFSEDSGSAEPLPPHAAIDRHETASAARKALSIRRI